MGFGRCVSYSLFYNVVCGCGLLVLIMVYSKFYYFFIICRVEKKIWYGVVFFQVYYCDFDMFLGNFK